MNRTAIILLANVLEYVGLALVIGGMVAIGAFVAPAVFHNIPLAQAAEVMTIIFRRYDNVLLISLGLVVLGEIMRIGAAGFAPYLVSKIRYAVVIVFTLLMLVSLLYVHPRIEQYQQAGVIRHVGPEGVAFDRLHQQSEMLYKAELYLALGILVLLTLTPQNGSRQNS